MAENPMENDAKENERKSGAEEREGCKVNANHVSPRDECGRTDVGGGGFLGIGHRMGRKAWQRPNTVW
jgi:hypothetical protein